MRQIMSSSWRLDLDHVRAEIGEEPRAMRPGDRRREVEYANAVEGVHRRSLPETPQMGCEQGVNVKKLRLP